MDLIRTILLKVEADPRFDGSAPDPRTGPARLTIEGHTDAEVTYHVVLLVEAGFLSGNIKMASMGNFVVAKLTWEGHELLDDIRDPEIWRKTKERAKSVTTVGLAFLWEIAKSEVKTKLGLL